MGKWLLLTEPLLVGARSRPVDKARARAQKITLRRSA